MSIQINFSGITFPILTTFLIFTMSSIIRPQQIGEDLTGRFYFTLQGNRISGAEYPNLFNAYKATGPAAHNSYYVGTLDAPSGSIGFGGALGYNAGPGIITFGYELEFSYIKHPDAKEMLEEDLFDGSNFNMEHYSTQFTQTGRQNTALLASGFFGMFPFSDFQLGFYISAGVGYGWQSFNSAATQYAGSKGYNTNTAGESDWFDLGNYEGNGDYSRGSVIYFVGLASEFYIMKNISLKLDYKYIASSYTKENVLISSGAVNVYQNSKSYEYTFASKLALGVSYYFD
ncbi:MAG: hypothetical protein WC061_01760 [Melioribacteraceae bacterium]